MKKVLLIVAPQELGYGYINTYFWQQGLLYLSTYLKNKIKNFSLDICDGNIRTLKECEAAVDKKYDLIGFHCVDHTFKNTINLAKRAINRGTKQIIFGGAGAIFSPESYLKKMSGFEQKAFIACCIS